MVDRRQKYRGSTSPTLETEGLSPPFYFHRALRSKNYTNANAIFTAPTLDAQLHFAFVQKARGARPLARPPKRTMAVDNVPSKKFICAGKCVASLVCAVITFDEIIYIYIKKYVRIIAEKFTKSKRNRDIR